MFRPTALHVALALAALLASPSALAFAPPNSIPSHHVGTYVENNAVSPSTMTSPARSNDVSLNMYGMRSPYGMRPSYGCGPGRRGVRGPRNVKDLHDAFVYAARPDLALTDQLIRLAKDNMKQVFKNLDSSKSPEGVINRRLQDMQNDLLKIQRAYQESVGAQRRLISQKRQVEAVADDFYRRAAYALKRGYERSAKDALSQRLMYQEAAKNIQVQIDAQTAASERLYEGMTTIEGTFREALEKRTELVTRAKTAQSVKKVNDLLGDMLTEGSGNAVKSYDAFSRLEEEVSKMEAEANGAESTNEGTFYEDPATDKLESEFENLEKSAAVEDEYEKLKADVKKWKAGSSSFKTDEEIEEELKKLGRRLIESGFF